MNKHYKIKMGTEIPILHYLRDNLCTLCGDLPVDFLD